MLIDGLWLPCWESCWVQIAFKSQGDEFFCILLWCLQKWGRTLKNKVLWRALNLDNIHFPPYWTRFSCSFDYLEHTPTPGMAFFIISWLPSCVWLFAAPWTVAHQAPVSAESSGQEYCSGWPFPSPRDLPDPRIERASLASPALTGGFFYHKCRLGSLLLSTLLLFFYLIFYSFIVVNIHYIKCTIFTKWH